MRPIGPGRPWCLLHPPLRPHTLFLPYRRHWLGWTGSLIVSTPGLGLVWLITQPGPPIYCGLLLTHSKWSVLLTAPTWCLLGTNAVYIPFELTRTIIGLLLHYVREVKPRSWQGMLHHVRTTAWPPAAGSPRPPHLGSTTPYRPALPSLPPTPPKPKRDSPPQTAPLHPAAPDIIVDRSCPPFQYTPKLQYIVTANKYNDHDDPAAYVILPPKVV